MSMSGPASVPGYTAPVEAAVFDWGGTLTPWHTVDFRSQWESFARGCGMLACALNDLVSRLCAAEDEAWARTRGEGHPSARITEVLRAAGVDPESDAAAAGMAAYEDFWIPHTITDPNVEGAFELLHDRGIKVGVLSNTIWTRAYHRGLFERDGVAHLIDADVYSSEIAHGKPHPEIFLETARRLEVVPEHCVYVGDRAFEDVHGGHGAGMRTILVPHSEIPAPQVVHVDTEPDAVAHELLDVLGIVDRWRARAGGVRIR